MRHRPLPLAESHRIVVGPGRSSPRDGCNGAFFLPFEGATLRIIASNGDGWRQAGLPGRPWEHVSVSLQDRCPTWREMCFVKDLFWSDTETVLQFHPRAAEYVNCHPYTLHLWRPMARHVQLPPMETIAPRRSSSDLGASSDMGAAT